MLLVTNMTLWSHKAYLCTCTSIIFIFIKLIFLFLLCFCCLNLLVNPAYNLIGCRSTLYPTLSQIPSYSHPRSSRQWGPVTFLQHGVCRIAAISYVSLLLLILLFIGVFTKHKTKRCKMPSCFALLLLITAAILRSKEFLQQRMGGKYS